MRLDLDVTLNKEAHQVWVPGSVDTQPRTGWKLGKSFQLQIQMQGGMA